MTYIEIILLGVGLAMDAFAVSVTKGLSMDRMYKKEACIIALYFGGFQAMMPAIGYVLGSRFMGYIESFDHWIAFLLLLAIGGKNLIEAIKGEDEEEPSAAETVGGAVQGFTLDHKELFVLAIATSIDALAVGLTLAMMPAVSVPLAVMIIGVVTFVISFAGVGIGRVFGSRYQKAATILGGVILIGIGLKILLEGLGYM